MAELTNMETKLGEVMGLAMAAQTATDKVRKLLEDDQQQLAGMLERMNAEAAETERRCMTIVDTLEGKKTAIGEEARATKQKGAEMLKIYLDASTEERARRRASDTAHTGSQAGQAAVAEAIQARDQSDKTRAASPLTLAQDAVLIDTTGMPIDEVVQRVLDLARERSA